MKKELLSFIRYDTWATGMLIDAYRKAENPPAKTLETLAHIISSRYIWYYRVIGEPSPVKIWEDYKPEDLRKELKQITSLWLDFLRTLKDDDVYTEITYKNNAGVEFTTPLFQIIFHLHSHSSYHRGQVMTLIRPHIKEVPVLDYIVFNRM
ncbi:MAG: DinB family protein [Ignavibacteriales bacterium]|nr:MAG: DinB family protein [Ignavibacteriales bacterium]